MAKEREGAVTMRGNPLTLIGPELKVGDKAPDFSVNKDLLTQVSLADTAGKVRIILTVPSLDTPVCSLETKKFNDHAAELPENVVVQVVSVDLPFAQKRFCGDEGVERVQTLSDHQDVDFGENYGVLIKNLRVLARAAFVVGTDDTLKHVEYVSEVASEPNYDAILAAAREAAAA